MSAESGLIVGRTWSATQEIGANWLRRWGRFRSVRSGASYRGRHRLRNTAQILEVERTTGACLLRAAIPERKRSARKARRNAKAGGGNAGQLRQRMSERLKARGSAPLRLRKSSIEPVFGIIKSVLGFRRFSLRGLEK